MNASLVQSSLSDRVPLSENPKQQESPSRFLVVTGFEPGNHHVGAVLLQQILDVLPSHSVRVICTLPRNDTIRRQDRNDLILRRRYESPFRPIGGSLGLATEYLGIRLPFNQHIAVLHQACVNESREHKCDGVLAVLDCPTTIVLASRLARSLRLPVSVFVMDSPEHLCQQYGYSPQTTRWILDHFRHVLLQAKTIAVAGESMQQAYREQYGKPCTVLRQGLPYEVCKSPPQRSHSNALTIGFSGSVTAPDAFQSLLRGLRDRKWQLAGRSVTLRFAGAQLRLDPDGPMRIEYFGWRSVSETIELMSACDVLYLPQPFSESLRHCAELSFPNKLCTYLPARRPVLLHSPRYGSLNQFFDQYRCGPISNQLDCNELLDELENLMSSDQEYERYLEGVERAFRSELNLQSLSENVQTFLGIGHCNAASGFPK